MNRADMNIPEQVLLKQTDDVMLMVMALMNAQSIRKYYSQDNCGVYDLAILRWYEEAPEEVFHISGPNGEILQLADGRFADTVTGKFLAKAETAEEAMFRLLAESATWNRSDCPLWGDRDTYDMEKLVGIEREKR